MKSTLVRNCTPYMSATFESKKFNLLFETVFKIWPCSKCIWLVVISRRRQCLTNEFAHALLRFDIISCIQSSWPNSSATGWNKTRHLAVWYLTGKILKECTFAEIHVECMKRFFFGSVYSSMHVIFILSNFV